MPLQLDYRAFAETAREIIACHGPDRAAELVALRQGTAALISALEGELGRLPTGEPNRSATLKRWRQAARSKEASR